MLAATATTAVTLNEADGTQGRLSVAASEGGQEEGGGRAGEGSADHHRRLLSSGGPQAPLALQQDARRCPVQWPEESLGGGGLCRRTTSRTVRVPLRAAAQGHNDRSQPANTSLALQPASGRSGQQDVQFKSAQKRGLPCRFASQRTTKSHLKVQVVVVTAVLARAGKRFHCDRKGAGGLPRAGQKTRS